MLSSKGTMFLKFQKIINYEIVRNLRGGVTIPVKMIKSNIPQKKKCKNTQKELEKLRKSNTGIGHTLHRTMEEFGDDMNQYMDEDFCNEEMSMEDIQPSINSYKDKYIREEKTKSFYNIERKYFKTEKLPNMLTYIEKHQIKHLNKEDPEFWNINKLAESFPATPDIIKKVLKSKFVAYTVEKVTQHDERVKKNWELFKNGALPVNSELHKIYSSFINRSKFETNKEEIKKFLPPPPDFASQIPNREFSNIITSSKKYQMEKENRKNIECDDEGRMIYNASHKDLHIIPEDEHSQSSVIHYTLDNFREKISLSHANKSKEVDTIILAEKPKERLTSSEESVPEKYKTYDYLRNIGVVNKDFDPFKFHENKDDIPLRIDIPPEFKSKNKVYKVRDCFYDEKGFFLYRVPGFVN